MHDKISVKINETPKILCKIHNNPIISVKMYEKQKFAFKLNSPQKINIRINSIPKILVKFGEQGLRGGDGKHGNHALLSNLDYDNSNHEGFQRKLILIPEYRAYEILDN